MYTEYVLSVRICCMSTLLSEESLVVIHTASFHFLYVEAACKEQSIHQKRAVDCMGLASHKGRQSLYLFSCFVNCY